LEECTLYESRKLVDRLVLGDHILLLGRLYDWLPRNHLGSEDIFLEEALLDKSLQVSQEGPTVDGLVPLAVVVEAVLFRPGQ